MTGLTASLIQSVAGQNMVLNPSAESPTVGVGNWVTSDLPGFLVPGAVLTRDSGPVGGARAGAWCFKVNCTADGHGIVAPLSVVGLTNGLTYTISLWVYNAAAYTGLVINLGNENTGLYYGQVFVTGKDAWQKITSTVTMNVTVAPANAAGTSGAVLAIYRPSTGGLATAPFFVDAVQVELGSAATTYIDGDQPGCYWNGLAHGSTSQRSAQSADGGLVVQIAPSATYIDALDGEHGVATGIGMAPLVNQVLPRGLLGGATFQRTVRAPRQFSFIGLLGGTSLDNLLAKRDRLVGLLKPDLYAQAQTNVVRVNNGGRVLNIRARYQGGLEFASLSGLKMQVPLSFMAYDPWWAEDFDSSARLSTSATVFSVNGIAQRTGSGGWQGVGGGGAGGSFGILAMALDANQNLYVGGDFSSMGGVAGTSNIAMWNPNTQAWSALGLGANGLVSAIAIRYDGTVYVGGAFASVDSGGGAVANTALIASWNPVNQTWSALGTGGIGGAGSQVYAAAVNNVTGDLFIVGDFPSMGGVANTLRAATFRTGSWQAMGTGLNNIGRAVVVSPDASAVYAGGDFTSAGGVGGTTGIAKWTGSAWVSLSANTVTSVIALAFAPNGDLYVAGGFTGLMGGVTGAANIARWNGANWFSLGSGVGSGGLGVETLAALPNGMLYVPGSFNSVDGGNLLTPSHFALWNGSAWVTADLVMPGSNFIHSMLYNPITGVLYAGSNINGVVPNGTGMGVRMVNNPTLGVTGTQGAATAYPKVYFIGPGTLYQLSNLTTGDTIFFNAYVMQAGEFLVLDLTPGDISFRSNIRGDVLGRITAGSNVTTFRLLPGANQIGCFIGGSTSAATDAWMVWRNQYWSVDSIL